MTRETRQLRIAVTGGNLRNSHIYLRRWMSFFPGDSLGAPNEREGSGRPLTLQFSGTGDESTTDIPRDKLIFRARAPWGRFLRHWRISEGEEVIFEEVGPRTY